MSITQRTLKEKDRLRTLKQERDMLLQQWLKAKDSQKVKILTRIMDIDEEIEIERNKKKQHFIINS